MLFIWFPLPPICLLSFSVHFPLTSMLLDSAAVGEGRSEYLPLSKKAAEVAFSWLWAQRKGLVFLAVCDCSRSTECKQTLMCGAALDTADTAQGITAHEIWGFGLTDCPLVLFFNSLKFPPTFTSSLFTTTGNVEIFFMYLFYNNFC